MHPEIELFPTHFINNFHIENPRLTTPVHCLGLLTSAVGSVYGTPELSDAQFIVTLENVLSPFRENLRREVVN